jgi:hypothetical protein
MKRLVLLLAVLASPLAAQLRLYEYVGGNEVAVGSSYDFGIAAPGDNVEKRFRVRNEGSDSINVTAFSAKGTGFQEFDGFTIPRLIAGGHAEDFHVRFSPSQAGSYHATLTINTIVVALNAVSPVLPAVEAQDSGAWQPLSVSTLYEFGTVERGSSLVKHFQVINRNAVGVLVGTPTITGDGFTVTNAWTALSPLGSGAALQFDVEFHPSASGEMQAVLQLDQRRFPIHAVAKDYPLPKPAISFTSAELLSAQQAKISVRFDAAARTSGVGLLRIEFAPASSLPDDPAILLVPQGSRSTSFQVTEGAAGADFGGQDFVTVQTGTTAGTLTVTAMIAGQTDTLRLNISPAAPGIDQAVALRSENILEIRLTGFDNTRSASRIAFTFYLKDGTVVAPGRMEADISAPFQSYFANTTKTGGAFSLRASFPASGPLTNLERVDIEFTNSAGTRRLDPLHF